MCEVCVDRTKLIHVSVFNHFGFLLDEKVHMEESG